MKVIQFSLLAAVLAGRPVEPQQAQEPSTYVEETKKDYLDKLQKCETAKDWKGLFAAVRYGLGRFPDLPGKHVETVVKVEENRWISLGEYLLARLSKLPSEAFDVYRLENDGPAEAEFAKARGRGSRRDLERLVDTYFFARSADEVLDALASESFDQGRAEEAVFFWNRLLRYYPDSEIPRTVTAARIAHACRVAGNEAALEDLRKHVAASKLDGKVNVGGEDQDLLAWLRSVRVPPRFMAPRPLKVPYAQGPLDRQVRRPLAVRNDIKRWTYDFAQDRGEPVAQSGQERMNPILLRRLQMQRDMNPGGNSQEFPMFPASARVRGRDYVLFTDGTRVVAIDPARVRRVKVQEGDKTVERDLGVYWKFPDKPVPRGPAGSNPNNFVPSNQPYVGVTVDGEYAFATMYSDPRVRPRDANPQMADLFEGATSVKCFHIPSGKLVWDTDAAPLHAEFKAMGQKFYDRNFAFASHPLVRGERLFLGLCTSPAGEQEGRVLCLDKRTGRPLWTTFLASYSNRTQDRWGGWNQGRQVSYLTLLAEHGGTLYAQTNMGAVAAIDPVTGNILWLTRYPRTAARGAGGAEGLRRPANWPLVCRGLLFVLPQDSSDLLAFERLTGKPVAIPPVMTAEQPLSWNTMSHLLGVVTKPNSNGELEDWLVISGQVSHVLKVQDFSAYTLAASNAWMAGRGAIEGEVVYLSCAVNDSSSSPPAPAPGAGPAAAPIGGLGLYDIRTWKNLERPAWKGENEFGNLLVAGNYLVVAAGKIVVYTDVETLRADFVGRLHQSPPHAETLLEFGHVMFENDRLAEAGEAYLGFIRAAEGDARHAGTVADVKRRLHDTFLRRGDEAAARRDFPKAIEFYGYAKSFAFDEAARAEATRKLASTYERQERWKDAVGQYQELVEGSRDLYHKESERVVKLWDHARERIAEIVGRAPEAYEEVEKRAAEALRKAAQEGTGALRGVMDRFPNSKTAREAWQRMKEALLKEGKLDKLRSLFGELKDRFKLDLDFDGSKELLYLLEKLGDGERLRYELGRFGERFGDRTIGAEGMEETVRDYVARRLAQLPPGKRSAPPLAWPLRPLGEREAVKVDPQGAGSGQIPLRPRGIEPPGFAPHFELFSRGSSVELWDLRERVRVWARNRPGAYLGALYAAGAELVADGVPVSGGRPGSPAQRAGLKGGDMILTIAGRPVTAFSVADVLGTLRPGETVELAFRRGGALEKASVELAEHPPEQRPGIVGASWTRDYSLAVAWEDGAASLDPATGAVQWSFRGIRPRFHVKAFGSTDGRLYLYESFRPDRERDPSWVATPGASAALPQTLDLGHRVICLSDFTGDPLWIHPFDLASGDPGVGVEASFHGKYLSEYATLYHVVTRSGNRDWSLWIFGADASVKPERRPLVGGPILAATVDEEAGTITYVTELTNERRERHLYSRSIEGGKKEPKPLEFALQQGKYMPSPPQNHLVVALAAERNLLAIVVSPSQAGGEHRLWVFKDGQPHREIKLPEGRTLPLGRASGAFLQDGLLFVYNVPKEKAGPGGRAFLTAFRVDGDPADAVAWEAVAPGVTTTAAATWAILPGTGSLLVFTAPRASVPGQPGENPMTVVYDKAAEGYLRQEHLQLVPFADGAGGTTPAAVWRGRLYVSAPQGMQLFGP